MEKAFPAKFATEPVGAGQGNYIRFHDRVLQAIGHRVYADAEHVLMILGVDIGCHFYAKLSGLIILCNLNRQYACKTDLEVDTSILIKMVVPDVLCSTERVIIFRRI